MTESSPSTLAIQIKVPAGAPSPVENYSLDGLVIDDAGATGPAFDMTPRPGDAPWKANRVKA
ncbi:MAG: hypothetical protein ACXW3D_01335 [Caulobacteraceae bacterium]